METTLFETEMRPQECGVDVQTKKPRLHESKRGSGLRNEADSDPIGSGKLPIGIYGDDHTCDLRADQIAWQSR